MCVSIVLSLLFIVYMQVYVRDRKEILKNYYFNIVWAVC